MNIKMTSRVRKIERDADHTIVVLDFMGKINDTKIVNDAAKTSMSAQLTMRTMVADQLKIGSIFTITLSSDEEGEVRYPLDV